MDKIARGLGRVFRIPLISQADGRLFKTSATLAVGDAKVGNRSAAPANLTAKPVAFTLGAVEPMPYELLTGHTSAATCRCIQACVTSGTWAGGDAAGTLFVEQSSGTFQSENIDGAMAGNSCLHIGGDLGSAGLPVELSNGEIGFAITAAEATMPYRGVGSLIIRDAAGAEWCDRMLRFENRDERDGIAFEGYIAPGGSTTAFTLVNGDGSGLPRIQAGCVLVPDGIPGRPIAAGFNSSTGAGTVTTAFASDPSGKRCVVLLTAPGDTASPVPAEVLVVAGHTLKDAGTATANIGGTV